MANSPFMDAYIEKASPFAQPILTHLRKIVHEVCPDVEEKMKWSMPHFDYRGEMMCHMAAFKQHCVFGFWKAALMKDKALLENAAKEDSMGHLGRITTIKELPTVSKMKAYIKEAMQLNDAGIKITKGKKPPKPEQPVPDYFLIELKKNKAAHKTFEQFPPSCRREYVEWIVEAKTENTRLKRMAQAIEWMAEGKDKNWKYKR